MPASHPHPRAPPSLADSDASVVSRGTASEALDEYLARHGRHTRPRRSPQAPFRSPPRAAHVHRTRDIGVDAAIGDWDDGRSLVTDALVVEGWGDSDVASVATEGLVRSWRRDSGSGTEALYAGMGGTGAPWRTLEEDASLSPHHRRVTSRAAQGRARAAAEAVREYTEGLAAIEARDGLRAARNAQASVPAPPSRPREGPVEILKNMLLAMQQYRSGTLAAPGTTAGADGADDSLEVSELISRTLLPAIERAVAEALARAPVGPSEPAEHSDGSARRDRPQAPPPPADSALGRSVAYASQLKAMLGEGGRGDGTEGRPVSEPAVRMAAHSDSRVDDRATKDTSELSERLERLEASLSEIKAVLAHRSDATRPSADTTCEATVGDCERCRSIGEIIKREASKAAFVQAVAVRPAFVPTQVEAKAPPAPPWPRSAPGRWSPSTESVDSSVFGALVGYDDVSVSSGTASVDLSVAGARRHW